MCNHKISGRHKSKMRGTVLCTKCKKPIRIEDVISRIRKKSSKK